MAVIAMTREIGSRAMEVAAGVAAKLGLKIIRSEVVADSIAERLGIKPSAFLRCMEGSASLIERWQINRRKLVHYTTEEILRVAEQGSVLIKGWGAATLLRDLPQVISVRVCAPMEFRVRVLMERLGSADAIAVREEIERHDAVRARTMATYFNVEREDAGFYHIVLNTERLSIAACINTIVQLGRRSKIPRAHDGALRACRQAPETMIGSAMAEEISPTMAPLGVSVSVANGKITLCGISSCGALRQKAETIAHTVAGAFPIDNRITSVPSHSRF
jgi:cytidylate kinase